MPDESIFADVLRKTEHAAPEELGFRQDDATYKSFQIVKVPRQHEAHDLKRGFYVKSNRGTIGYVPWAGSTVVWPWEAGWEQDLRAGGQARFRKGDTK